MTRNGANLREVRHALNILETFLPSIAVSPYQDLELIAMATVDNTSLDDLEQLRAAFKALQSQNEQLKSQNEQLQAKYDGLRDSQGQRPSTATVCADKRTFFDIPAEIRNIIYELCLIKGKIFPRSRCRSAERYKDLLKYEKPTWHLLAVSQQVRSEAG
jgi:hypothetical protein